MRSIAEIERMLEKHLDTYRSIPDPVARERAMMVIDTLFWVCEASGGGRIEPEDIYKKED